MLSNQERDIASSPLVRDELADGEYNLVGESVRL